MLLTLNSERWRSRKQSERAAHLVENVNRHRRIIGANSPPRSVETPLTAEAHRRHIGGLFVSNASDMPAQPVPRREGG